MWWFTSVTFSILMYKANAICNACGSTTASYYSNCVIELMGIFFDKPGHIIFANSYNVTATIETVRSDLLHHINVNPNLSVQVITATETDNVSKLKNEEVGVIRTNPFFEFKADYFIVLSENYNEFTYLASKITNSPSWNAKAKFIIVLFFFSALNKTKITDVKKIMNCMFFLNAINMIVLVPQSENIRNAVIYGVKPTDATYFFGFLNERFPIKLTIKTFCNIGVLKNKTVIYNNVIPSNLKGCTLKILALERKPFVSESDNDPSIEKQFIDEIAKKHKLTIKYEILNMHRGERNPAWNGALKELLLRKGHVLLGGIFPDYDVYEDFECSSTYLEDSYAWVVPRANFSPRWLALVVMFQNYVWLSAVAMFTLCVLTWRVIGQLSDDSYYHANIWHCLLNTWVSILGFPAYIKPVKNSLRTFFAFFSIFCLIFITAYQAKLIDVLRHVSFQNQIETIEDLITSGLKFGGPEELHDLFYNSSGLIDIHIQKQWINVENITKALIDVTVYRNFSVLCSRLELSYLTSVIPELSDSLGYNRYYAFKQNTFTVPIEMIAVKGFPILDKISNTVSLLKQIGVSKRLQKNLIFFNMRKRPQELTSAFIHKSTATPLSVKDLQGGFLALALGIVLGIVAFVLELIFNINYVRNKLFKNINK